MNFKNLVCAVFHCVVALHIAVNAQAETIFVKAAAEIVGWEGQTGAVAPGYHADIIAVNGNPLEDASLSSRTSFLS